MASREAPVDSEMEKVGVLSPPSPQPSPVLEEGQATRSASVADVELQETGAHSPAGAENVSDILRIRTMRATDL